MPLCRPPVGILIAVSVPQTGAGGKERKRLVWAIRRAPVAELEAIPALDHWVLLSHLPSYGCVRVTKREVLFISHEE